MRFDRRLRSGYYDLGPVRIPVQAQPIIMTDRSTGIQYLITWSLTIPTVDGYGHLSVNSDVNIDKKFGTRTYSAFDGPVFGTDGEYMLMVRNGRMGLDYNRFPIGVQDLDSPPIMLRQKGTREVRQLVLTKQPIVHPVMIINEAIQDG